MLNINTNLKELAKKNGWLFEVATPPSIQISYPSNTIEEDLLYVTQDWAKLLTQPAEERTKLGREEYFYHLHCVTDYEIDETFICVIPDAVILNPIGLTITSDLEIIRQSLAGQNREISLNPEQIKKKIEDNQVIPGTYVSLLSYYTLNFAHWLMDCLPKLSLLESLSDSVKADLKFIIPEGSPHYIIDSLKLLGIPENQTISISEQGIQVEKLILCYAAQNLGRPSQKHILTIRDKFLSSVIDKKEHNLASRRLYISRSQSSRKIVNEEEILQVLKNYNFEVVHCESMSFAEQIGLFSEAEVVLGSHGAGIYNQIFCRFGTTIIEIYNKDYWHHSSRIISSFMSHTHWHIFGENVSQDWQTWVNPLKLEKILSMAL
ncbi:MAG: glycosyltransferase family 61 protein [Cyanobacteriota bacterium]|nr:glycosyltransferase family 61 protein [Cyanobacteriota bacterium]